MLISEEVTEFYMSLDGLKQKMSTVSHDIDAKKNCLKNSLDEMSEKVNRLTIIDSDAAKNNKKMFDNCLLVFDDIKNASTQWKSTFEDILAKEDFRNEFKDSFLVIIYGKVKAGKSSFGNFIAANCLEDQKAKYFKYDEAGIDRKEIAELEELDDDDNFDVKNTEATIEIQGFRLSGLTWIDTPGLASMTAVNGALAKEYIESADLVVYPVSSDAPGRATDTKEILELFDKNKTVNVIITKSDKSKKQVIDGNIVKVLQNKTSENRAKQEEYVLNEIKSLLPEEKRYLLGDIYSLSVHTAKKALASHDKEFYSQSNMDLFFEQMSKIIQSDALTLKTQAPHNRLKSFVELEIIGSGNNNASLAQIRNSLNEIELKREEVLENLHQEKENLIGDLSLDVEYSVDKRYHEMNKDNIEKNIQDILMEIQSTLTQRLEHIIMNALDGFNESILDLNMQLDSESFKIEDKKEKMQYNDTSRKKNIGKAVAVLGGGLLTAWAIANFWNPTGWAAGAAALAVESAAMAGAGYVGGKAGESFGEDREEEVIVGDNKTEIISKIKISVQKLVEEHTEKVISQLDTFYFKPIADFSKGMNHIIDELEENLKECIND